MIAVAVLVGCTGSSSDDDRAREVQSIRGPVEMEVFMRVGATASQIGAVRTALRRSRLVRKFEYVSQQDAFREFGRLFADQPDLVATTDPRALPASFRIEPVDGANRGLLARSLERIGGIDEVRTLGTFADCGNLEKKHLSGEQEKALSLFC